MRVAAFIFLCLLQCFSTYSQNKQGIEMVITNQETAAAYIQELKQESNSDVLTKARINKLLCDYYYLLKKKDSMLIYAAEALKYFEKTTDTFYLYYCNFRIIDEGLNSNQNFPAAIEFLKKAAAYYERTQENIMAVNCHFVLSKIYKEQQLKQLRTYHLQRGFELNKNGKDTNMQMVMLYSRLMDEQGTGNWGASINTGNEAFELAKIFKKPHFIKSSLVFLGYGYFYSGNYEKAIRCFEDALQMNAPEPADHFNAASYLVDCYIKLGMQEKAANAFTRYKHIRDSIEQLSNKKNINELLAKYEAEKKQAALSLLQKQNELTHKAAESRKTWIIILVVFIASFIPVSLLAFYNIRKRHQLEKVNEMRNKISRDLHDEVGAILSSIQVYAAVAEKSMQQQPEMAKEAIRKIEDNTAQAMDNMSDIVWAIKTFTTDETTLTDKLKNYGFEILTARNINCTYDINEEAERQLVNVEARRNILLIAKEAMNNAAKHSGATEVTVRAQNEEGYFVLEISDNGKGMNPSTARNGNGISNMKKRAELMKAELLIESALEKGTHITCKIPLANISH